MDYKTKSTTREELRKLENVFDLLANTTDQIYKPVTKLLDRLYDILPFVSYEIVNDNEFDINIPARGFFISNNDYVIQIKEYVYLNAIKGNGACRGIIMHEIFHPFLYSIGFVPLFETCYKEGELNPYESVERQVKAITGEYMMNYEKNKNLTEEEICTLCGVSKSFAKNRKLH